MANRYGRCSCLCIWRLELSKGLGANGAMFNFPVLQVTADLVLRPEKFPNWFWSKSRDYFVKQLPKSFRNDQTL